MRLAEINKRTAQCVPASNGRGHRYDQKIAINIAAGDKYIYPNYPIQLDDPQFWMVSEKVFEGQPGMRQWHPACIAMILPVTPRAHSLQPQHIETSEKLLGVSAEAIQSYEMFIPDRGKVLTDPLYDQSCTQWMKVHKFKSVEPQEVFIELLRKIDVAHTTLLGRQQ